MQENNHNNFTAADIEKYHKGLLTAKERHAIEKAALDDPFLADALEGYALPSAKASDDLDELRNRLAARIDQNKKRPLAPVLPSSFSWWKVAAMVILILGAGLLVYQFGFNTKQGEIAQANKNAPPGAKTNEENIAAPDSVTPLKTDSSSSDVAIEGAGKDLNLKKTESSAGLVKPDEATEQLTAESKPGKDNKANTLPEASVSNTPTASVITDDKEKETKKSLRNDNAVDKAAVAERNEDAKKKELAQEQKAEADDIPGRSDYKVISKSAANSAFPKQQGFYQPNVFRGRVTDVHNNALPFSNITNLEDSIGTYSDARGYFNLTSPDSVLNVQVRSLGFESNNFLLRNKVPENKVLLEEDRSLNAVVLDTVKRNTNRLRNNNMVLQEPEPVDGWSNYDLYLVNNLKTPGQFRSKQPGGQVELSFDVDKNGEPVNITVKKSLCESCDREAIRLLKEGPKWKGKMKKRKATVTISF